MEQTGEEKTSEDATIPENNVETSDTDPNELRNDRDFCEDEEQLDGNDEKRVSFQSVENNYMQRW